MKLLTIAKGGRVSLDTDGLERIRAELAKAQTLRCNVGILAANNGRDDGETNAEVGLKMEFGSVLASHTTVAQQEARDRGPMNWPAGFPARSWLRMPVLLILPKMLKLVPAEAWFQSIETRGLEYTLGFMGELALDAIRQGFLTTGYGTWKGNSVRTITWKKSNRPLIDSGQLMDAVSAEVVKV